MMMVLPRRRGGGFALGDVTVLGAYTAVGGATSITYSQSVSPTAGALIAIGVSTRASGADITHNSITPGFSVVSSFTSPITASQLDTASARYLRTSWWIARATAAPGSGTPVAVTGSFNQGAMIVLQIPDGVLYGSGGAATETGTTLDATLDETTTGADTIVLAQYNQAAEAGSLAFTNSLAQVTGSPFDDLQTAATATLRSAAGPTTTGITGGGSNVGKTLSLISVRVRTI